MSRRILLAALRVSLSHAAARMFSAMAEVRWGGVGRVWHHRVKRERKCQYIIKTAKCSASWQNAVTLHFCLKWVCCKLFYTLSENWSLKTTYCYHTYLYLNGTYKDLFKGCSSNSRRPFFLTVCPFFSFPLFYSPLFKKAILVLPTELQW